MGNVAIAMLSFFHSLEAHAHPGLSMKSQAVTAEVRAIFISSVAAWAVWGLTLRASPLRLGACPMPLGLP